MALGLHPRHKVAAGASVSFAQLASARRGTAGGAALAGKDGRDSVIRQKAGQRDRRTGDGVSAPADYAPTARSLSGLCRCLAQAAHALL